MKVKTSQKYVNSKLIEKEEHLFTEYVNKIESIAPCCDAMSKLCKDGVISVRFGKSKDLINEHPSDFHTPFVCIVKTFIKDYGDYSYDGEDEVYEPNLIEEENLYEIKVCPFCGKKIKIENKAEDCTKRVNEKLKMLPKNKRTKQAKEIFDQINKILEQKIF